MTIGRPAAIGDLFAGAAPGEDCERLAEGAVLLRGFALAEAPALVAAVDDVAAISPFRHMVDAGRVSHVGGDDELRRGRLGHRPQRLSLFGGRPDDRRGRGRRCRRFSGRWRRAPRRARVLPGSSPTLA